MMRVRKRKVRGCILQQTGGCEISRGGQATLTVRIKQYGDQAYQVLSMYEDTVFGCKNT